MSRYLLIMFVGLGLVGCASTPANLQRETAKYVGGVMSDQVTVSNIKRGATSVSWNAATPTENYKCEADDMVRVVNCVKKK